MDVTKIAANLLYVYSRMKMFHWSTGSYARHKASDAFVEEFAGLMDSFVETMMGTHGTRVSAKHSDIVAALKEEEVFKFLNGFCSYLCELPLGTSPELLNIRDDMLSLSRQTIYLLTLK